MADADEDNFSALATNESEEADLTDETQDFRFLTSLTAHGDSSAQVLPRRGEKDFEPHHGLSSQEAALASSRAAMHNALSYPRIHLPRHQVIGVYHPEIGRVRVRRVKGQIFNTLGVARKDGLWLLPEEALYLIEGGRLDIRWPVMKEEEDNVQGEGEDEADKDGTAEEQGLPMSLQGAYAAFIGMEAARTGGRGLTLERYNVYASLKRLGYNVHRAYDWEAYEEDGDLLSEDCNGKPLQTQMSKREDTAQQQGLWQVFWQILRSLSAKLINAPPVIEYFPLGPLVRPGLYRSYNEIFPLLDIIPAYNPADSSFQFSNTESHLSTASPKPTLPYRVTYHVWKPASHFRKSAPPPPDYQVCVINATESSVPTLCELSDLMVSMPYDPPEMRESPSGGGIGMVYRRLKHGYRNVILAVVDRGIVSYTEVVDAGFSQERIYELRPTRGGKGGRGRGRAGRRGGRGRGRGAGTGR